MIDLTYYEYENVRRVSYDGGACFIPVCEKCGRFVRENATITVSEEGGLSDEPNAMCKKCGPTRMPFEGFVGDCSV